MLYTLTNRNGPATIAAMSPNTPPVLTGRRSPPQVDALTAQDDVLAATVARFGPPPFWRREPGWHAAPHHPGAASVAGLGQGCVATGCAAVDPLTPAGVLALTTTLRRIGFSRQKTAYAHRRRRWRTAS
ncbi:MAG: hypothetical protein R2854_11015 [Caldilineaceae bacterium]